MHVDDESFAGVLAGLIDAQPFVMSPGMLSKLSSIPKGTIVNWLDGRARRPRRWQDVLKVAEALRVPVDQAERLLRAAGHPPLAELNRRSRDADQQLFDRWRPDLAVAPPLPPLPGGPLVGRAAELVAVEAMLRDDGGGFVNLIGPVGVGKSRLALEIAHRLHGRFRDGVAFLPLAGLSDPDTVADHVARRLGCRRSDCDDVGPAIKARLAERSLLIVLDNVDLSAATLPALISTLNASPGVRVLTTSRRVIRATGERQVLIGPLSTDRGAPSGDGSHQPGDAVVLFLERARGIDPRFDPSPSELAAIEEICRRLDHLPLAIELAAARTRILRPAPLLERLSEDFGLLNGGYGDTEDRHRSLYCAIDWSYQLLSCNQRRLLRLLAAFPGGVDLAHLESIAPDKLKAGLIDDLMTLVDSSMVQTPGGFRGATFTMLNTIRTFVMLTFSEDDDVFGRHGP